MCAHYNVSSESVREEYPEYDPQFDFKGSYDLYPWQNAPVAVQNEIELMRWGLIPNWIKTEEDAKKFSRHTFNARSESMHEKPSFKHFLNQRCIIFVSEWFEYHEYEKKPDGKAIKIKFTLPDRKVFAVAGLYNIWKDKVGKELATFTMITTEPAQDVKPFHPRNIAILEKGTEQDYLNPDVVEYDQFKNFFMPYQGKVEHEIM